MIPTVLHVLKVVGIVWGVLLGVFLIVWPIALTPRRRAERAAERCLSGQRMCPARRRATFDPAPHRGRRS